MSPRRTLGHDLQLVAVKSDQFVDTAMYSDNTGSGTMLLTLLLQPDNRGLSVTSVQHLLKLTRISCIGVSVFIPEPITKPGTEVFALIALFLFVLLTRKLI